MSIHSFLWSILLLHIHKLFFFFSLMTVCLYVYVSVFCAVWRENTVHANTRPSISMKWQFSLLNKKFFFHFFSSIFAQKIPIFTWKKNSRKNGLHRKTYPEISIHVGVRFVTIVPSFPFLIQKKSSSEVSKQKYFFNFSFFFLLFDDTLLSYRFRIFSYYSKTCKHTKREPKIALHQKKNLIF